MSDWYFNELTPDNVNSLFFRLMRGYKRSLAPEMSRFRSADQTGSLPVTFTLAALGCYLAPGERSSVIDDDGEMLSLDRFLIQAIENGTNPHHAGYWNLSDKRYSRSFPEQAASVAFAAFLSRSLLFRRLNNQGIQNLEQWLESAGKLKVKKRSYHVLATALNHAARKGLGFRYDESAVDSALEAAERSYFEEGWFSEGGARSRQFDDSVSWGYLALLSALLFVEGGKRSAHYEQWTPRIRKTLKDFAYLYDPRGGSCEYGDTSAGLFSRLSGPLAGSLIGAWPGKAGMLKRMVRLQINQLTQEGGFDPESGELILSGKQSDSFSRYRMMQTLGFLLLHPVKDPFWKAKEEHLPSERGDFIHYMPTPGWLVHGAKKDGHVQLLNAGSALEAKRGTGHLLTRYGKFCYSSRMGFVTTGGERGIYVCDNTLSASEDKKHWSHRNKIISHRLIGERVVYSSYNLEAARQKGRGCMLKVETIIIPIRSGAQIRLHRVRRRGIGGGVIHLREGGYALGIGEEEAPKTIASGDLARAEGEHGFSLVRILGGYTFAAISQGYEGIGEGHTSAPRYLLPRVEAVLHPGEHLYLALFIHSGTNINLIDKGASISFSRNGDSCRLLSGDKSFFEFDFQSS